MKRIGNFYLRQSAYAALHALFLLLALSPFDLWPFGFLALLVMLQSVAEQVEETRRRVAIAALCFSVATTCITFFWIFATIHRYTGQNYALTSVLGLAYTILFQLKFGVVFFALRLLRLQHAHSFSGMLASAAVIAVADAVAPELFPWSWGNAIAAEGHLRELAALGSVYAMSFMAAFVAFLAVNFLNHGHGKMQSGVRFFLRPTLFTLAILAFCVALRYWPEGRASRPPLRLAVVQTNIGAAASAKQEDADFATDAVNRLFNQSTEALQIYAPLDLLIWGEASMPFHSAARDVANRDLYSPTFDGVLEYLRRRAGVSVVFQDMYRGPEGLASRFSVRDAAESQYEQQYFKRRLVPWGEYLPLERSVPRLRKWFPEAGRFSAARDGSELSVVLPLAGGGAPTRSSLVAESAWLQDPQKIRSTFSLPARGHEVTLKPLLCYEALYPADARIKSADMIVNLASDAWFGDGIEGAQHAAATKLRAVENGVPMVRAAMSGISFAVDYHGDNLVPQTGQGRPELLFAEVALLRRRTPFSRFGMPVFYLLMLAASWPWLMQRFVFSRTRESI